MLLLVLLRIDNLLEVSLHLLLATDELFELLVDFNGVRDVAILRTMHRLLRRR